MYTGDKFAELFLQYEGEYEIYEHTSCAYNPAHDQWFCNLNALLGPPSEEKNSALAYFTAQSYIPHNF